MENKTLNEMFAEYFPAFKSYVYTDRWIEQLVETFATDEGFATACGHYPTRTRDADTGPAGGQDPDSEVAR